MVAAEGNLEREGEVMVLKFRDEEVFEEDERCEGTGVEWFFELLIREAISATWKSRRRP